MLLMDGSCALCNRSQRFLEPRLVRSGTPRIIPLASTEGESLMATLPESMEEADSMVLLRNGTPFIRSGAAIRCVLYMRWHWRWTFPLLWLIPSPIRDGMYRILARNRQMIFERG